VDEIAAHVAYVEASACGHLSDALGFSNQEDSQCGFPQSSQPGGSLPELARSCGGLQRPPHFEANAKSCIDRAARAEAAGDIGSFRMGIADNAVPIMSEELP
jgi:hypothetical protein